MSSPLKPSMSSLFLAATLTTLPALAASPDPEVTQLLQDMQARLQQLEVRNAELERRLARVSGDAEAGLATRMQALEDGVTALQKQAEPLEKLQDISLDASLTLVAQRARGGGCGPVNSPAGQTWRWNCPGDPSATPRASSLPTCGPAMARG